MRRFVDEYSIAKDSPVNLKKGFLILAFAMVSIIALLYGVSPSWFAMQFLGMNDLRRL